MADFDEAERLAFTERLFLLGDVDRPKVKHRNSGLLVDEILLII
jgi:hypothetical protein